jgi:hypothetical protein
MSEWLTKAEAKKLIWYTAAVLLLFFAIDSIATAFVSVMIDVNWSSLTSTQKAIRMALVLKAFASTMLAALTTVVGKLQKDEFPVPTPGAVPSKTEETKTV